MDNESWYRYESRVVDDYEDCSFVSGGEPIVDVYCTAHRVVKHTPCGVRLARYYPHKDRWVSITARKRFAYPTRELALESFTKRKRKQVEILQYQLSHAKAAIKYCEDAALKSKQGSPT